MSEDRVEYVRQASAELPQNPKGYNKLSIGLHWLMVLLFVAVYATIECRTFFERGTDMRNLLKEWHFILGLTIFTLVWLRLAARVLKPAPPILPTPPQWQTLLARLVHAVLYALMIGMPIAGWLILSGEGKPIPFWGLELPALIGPNKDLAHEIEELHELFGKVGYFLIALHAVAALVHHYFFKDNTLKRMLPVLNKRTSE